MKKRNSPGRWEHTVSGNSRSGESGTKACKRELEEELGVKLKEEDFIFVGEYLEQIYWHIGQLFIVHKDFDITKMKLDPYEVDCVKWHTLDQLKEIIFTSKFGPFEDGYKKWTLEKLEEQIKLKQKTKPL